MLGTGVTLRRLALIFASITLAGCGSSPDRAAVLDAAAATVIVPTYEHFAVAAAALASEVELFCGGGAGVADVEAAIATTHRSWAATEPMWIGPVMDRRSWAVIDWPIAAEEIDALLADTSIVLDEERISRRIGADQRGLEALEHLISGAAGGESGAGAQRRCDYLTGVADLIAAEADLLVGDWTVDFDGGAPWVSVISAEPDVSVDAMVNDALFMLEAMADAELGTALGEMDREADAEAIVEGPLGLGVEDLSGRLSGLRAVFVGSVEDPGLSELLGSDLTSRLDAQLEEAEQAVTAIDGSLAGAVQQQPAQVSAARAAIKAVQITMSTEVVSRLGVTIGFSDADGDTGG